MDNSGVPEGGFISKLIGKGWLFWLALIAGGLLWEKILPRVLEVLEGTLTGLIYAGAIAIIMVLAFSPEVQLFGYKIFKRFTGLLLGSLVKYDPFGTMKTYVDRIKNEEMPKIKQKLSEITGFKITLQKRRVELERTINNYLSKAQAALNAKDEESANLFSEQASTAEQSINNLEPMYEQVCQMEVFFQKIHETAKFVLTKLETELEIKQQEYELMLQGSKIIGSAKKFMGADRDRQLFDESSKEISKKYSMIIGEIQTLMKDSESTFTEMKYEKSGNAIRGRDMLREFEQRRKAIERKVDLPANQIIDNAKQTIREAAPYVAPKSNSKKSLF